MARRFCIELIDGEPCAAIFDGPTQRCPPHQAAADKRRNTDAPGRPSATQRGYGAQHRNRAQAVVADATARHLGCCYCGGPAGQPGPHATSGKPDPFVGCHVQPQSRGGQADGPLRAGHRSCNNAAAGKLNRGKRR